MKSEYPPDGAPPSHSRRNVWVAAARGFCGGAVGGGLGYLAFRWMLTQGYYALVLPGALIGMGAGLGSGRRMLSLGLLSAVGALVVGVVADWNSLIAPAPTFLGHVATLLDANRRTPAILILVGVAISFYFGIGRDRR
jgi:L-aminopeptidase/D-esterase-like protein